ncbi:ORF6N domain-containing protein [Paracidovorax oryzae]|uniref:ORF6N domain-containing protein n=1 Tax=Paracidovorax oryzae TaxID=862720 RepID=UPI0035CF3FFB
MTIIVKINDTDMQVIDYRGQRVATLAQIDAVHGRPEGTARRTFNDHKHRMVEGEDYFVRNASEARAMGITAPNGLTLMTEQGYTMLVKPFTDDLAWQVQRQVVTGYFRSGGTAARVRSERGPSGSGLLELRRARALDIAAKTAERIVAQFPSLSEDSRRVVFAKVINPVAGVEVLALPRVEQKHYQAGEVGDMLGISGAMVGRIANQNGLKTEEHGYFRLDKSAHSAKQVETFVYNDKGVEAIRSLMPSTSAAIAPKAQARRELQAV